MGGEEITQGETHGSGGGSIEKIMVSIRVRPLNEKEITRNDISDWECINNTTIICKNNLPERSLFPSAYAFDRVFGFDSHSKEVYEEGAKEVALCVLRGINSSIFAYGQTSSGKTYTMSGITQYAMDDIFDYIEKNKKREFSLKFSAIEIYNEAVRDLLSSDSTPLRLLDDPERGTVVEKLIEENLIDRNHLEELLSICETQRKMGETSLNETSSRSHQILRLTIESSAREYSGETSSTLAASVSFVDLAGSERASQTLSAGTRLKEGCHINRSLLTLGTVIRKLSKGKSGHVPYRDSKLTRILQNSLGGKARTAIICTMSPARSHVEQSRNTLLFASCAKEVATNAQVNLVVSEKALVKQLQRELAKMESELRSLGSDFSSSDFSSLLKQKEELIEKMEKQIKELTWQRDLAQSRVENLLRSVGEDQSSKQDEYSMTSSLDIGNPLLLEAELRGRTDTSRDFDQPRVPNRKKNDYLDLSENSVEDDFLLDDSTPQFSGLDPGKGWEEIAPRADELTEDVCKEVRCIEMERSNISGKAEEVENQRLLDVIVDKTAIAEVLSLGIEEKDELLIMECAKDENRKLSQKSENGKFGANKKYEDNEKSLKTGETEFCPSRINRDNENDLKSGGMEQVSRIEDGKLSSCAKQNEQSPNTGNIKFSSCAEQKDDKLSLQNGDKELDECDKQEHDKSSLPKEDREATPFDDTDNIAYEALKEKVKEMQKTIEYLMSMHALEQQSTSSEADYSSPGHFKLKRSRSCREILFNVQSPLWFEKSEHSENTSRDFIGRSRVRSRRLSGLKDTSGTGRFLSQNSRTSSTSFDVESSISSTSIDARSTKESDTENGGSFHEFIAGLKAMVNRHQLNDEQYKSQPNNIEITPDDVHDFASGKREVKKIKAENGLNSSKLDMSPTTGFVTGANEMADNQLGGEFGDDLVKEAVSEKKDFAENRKDAELEKVQGAVQPCSSRPSEFGRQQREIIELWTICNVPLVHRTYFFLLFKGDPSDFVYMEVELRRLSFLKNSSSLEREASRRQSTKTLNREREWLRRQIPRKFSQKEREELYQKWGIKLNTKQRSLQVVHSLWTDTQNMEHIKESACLVAKLVGFVKPSEAPKEMFGLALSPRSANWRSLGRKHSKSFSSLSFIG